MTRQEFLSDITRRNVNPRSYALDRESDEADCLLIESGRWLVFYLERNESVGLKSFPSELEALDLLHGRLTRYLPG